MLTAEQLAADDDALTLIARHADGGMRDALSVLDQCLSFGEGAVTADRVREVLAWWTTSSTPRCSSWWSERRPAAVFPLVDRLMDAGVDLAEFMGGAAEVLRGLLMLQVGAEPEGMTEALRARWRAIARARAGRCAADAAAPGRERTGIRRSVNPRLVVETLLLRWAMLDRIVDLEEVIRRGSGEAGSG